MRLKGEICKMSKSSDMDAEHLEFPDGSFDVVFCSFAIFFLSPARAVSIGNEPRPQAQWAHCRDNLGDTRINDGNGSRICSNPIVLENLKQCRYLTRSPHQMPVFNTPEGLEAILGFGRVCRYQDQS